MAVREAPSGAVSGFEDGEDMVGKGAGRRRDLLVVWFAGRAGVPRRKRWAALATRRECKTREPIGGRPLAVYLYCGGSELGILGLKES
jgi:hypothetical protein